MGRVVCTISHVISWKNLPCLYNAHGWAFLRDTAEWKRKVYACIERILLLKTDAVVDVSKYEYEAAIRYGLPPENSILSTAVFQKRSQK